MSTIGLGVEKLAGNRVKCAAKPQRKLIISTTFLEPSIFSGYVPSTIFWLNAQNEQLLTHLP